LAHHFLLVIENNIIAFPLAQTIRNAAARGTGVVAPDALVAICFLVPPKDSVAGKGSHTAAGMVILGHRKASRTSFDDRDAVAFAALGHHLADFKVFSRVPCSDNLVGYLIY